ncbi:MAG: ABC transporter substrate-binding protein [Gammaproteobacteria bacterium]|nr:ABC transporter substrate-binding protein [Gammaproteobacteria bacterium]
MLTGKEAPVKKISLLLLLVTMGMSNLCLSNAWASEYGVTDSTIRIGGVMDLKGDAKGLGQGMKIGIEAAIKGERIQGRRVTFSALNDFYNPKHTIEATERLLKQGTFLVMGNVGTPTAKVSLPILAQNNVPAVGFFTGAGILRPGEGDIINYRASYVQETANVINAAMASGIRPRNICAFVQNDAYGMAGVAGIKRALAKQSSMKGVVKLLDQIIAVEGENPVRNNIGPIGTYARNTLKSREGYISLKRWEEKTGDRCRLVVTVGAYAPIAGFAGYSRYKNEDWLISAVSFTGADNLKEALKQYRINEGVIMTQVVPALDSNLAIVKKARKAIAASQFGYVSLEGYIVGKLFLKFMRDIKGDITRNNFLKAVRGSKFEFDGLKMDFSKDNQGSDFVMLRYLDGDGYRNMKGADWRT